MWIDFWAAEDSLSGPDRPWFACNRSAAAQQSAVETRGPQHLPTEPLGSLSTVRCFLESDLGRFAARVRPFLVQQPIEHNVLLTILGALSVSQARAEPLLAWVGEETGDVHGVAIRTPPRKLLLSRMPVAPLETLAVALARHAPVLPGVVGLEPEARVFADVWAQFTGRPVALGMAQRLYRLDRVTLPKGVAGLLRAAAPAELEALAGWAQAFAAEAGVEGPDPRAFVEQLIRERRLFVWDNTGVVSMCALSPTTAGVARVSLVYTPPEHRRRGYASACVAAASQSALGRAADTCVLYTDLANPTSNAIYQAIGYVPVADAQEYAFG